MRAAATPITKVAIQPRKAIDQLETYGPITERFDASRMMTAIKGTATTPLITALQNSAFIGLIGEYKMSDPAITLNAMTL